MLITGTLPQVSALALPLSCGDDGIIQTPRKLHTSLNLLVSILTSQRLLLEYN